MKTVIVTPQIPIAENGGIGTFVWYFSQLLRKANDDVSIILTHRPQAPRKLWLRPFKALGIDVTWWRSLKAASPANGYDWHQGVSERVAELIPDDTDIVYFADWEANGFHMTQSRRFSAHRSPVVVTVLHGAAHGTVRACSNGQAVMKSLPLIPRTLRHRTTATLLQPQAIM